MSESKKGKFKVAVYMRVANMETTKEDSSLEKQKVIINQYLKKKLKGIETKEYYIDNGVSGVTYNRPEFKRMLKDIKKNKVNVIIVKDLMRFARCSNALGKIEEWQQKYGINFISVSEEIDSINRKAEFEIILSFYHYIHDSQVSSIKTGRRMAKFRKEGIFKGRRYE